MIGHLQSTIQRLGIAVALVSTLSVASASAAAPTNPSKTDHIGGVPCNDLCKAYLAWSDRVMARFHPRPPQQPQDRIALHRKKPERTLSHLPGPRHSNLGSFAQFRRETDGAPPAVETPLAETAAPSDSIRPMSDRFFQTDGNATTGLADSGSATNEAP